MPLIKDMSPLMKYVQVLFKRRYVVLCVALIVFGTAAVWTFSETRIYEATLRLMVDRKPPQVLGQEVREVVDISMETYSKEYLETQKNIITSYRLAFRVAQKLNLPASLSFWKPATGSGPKTLHAATKRLQSLISVVSVRDANLIDIAVRHADPQLAALLANTLGQLYVAYTTEYRYDSTMGASKWLVGQLDELKNQLHQTELSLYNFKRNNNVISVSLEDKQNMVARKIEKLTDGLTEISMKRMALQSRAQTLKGVKQLDALDVAFDAVIQDTFVTQLKAQYVEEHNKYLVLKQRYLAHHPLLQEQNAKLQGLRANLDREVNKILQSISLALQETQNNEVRLAAALSTAKSEALQLNHQALEYQRLYRAQQNAEKLYATILTRSEEADLSGQLRTSNVRILDQAREPERPIRPHVPINLGIGLLMGIVLGVGLAIVLESIDSTIKTSADIESTVGLPLLGVMPHMPTDQSLHGDLIVHHSPRSAIAESCRAIRTNVLFAEPDTPLKMMLITSPGPREGKTTTAVSLAIAMAQAGSRVLLVDGDLRRPRLHRVFDLPSDQFGITSVLLKSASLRDAIHHTFIDGLKVLPCGLVPPNPAELCQSAPFKEALTQVAAQFDRVIIDSPPIMAVTDAVIMSTLADGTLLVARSLATSQQALHAAAKQLADVNAKVIGCVLNDFNQQKHGYGYYRYNRYRYDYGDQYT